MRKVMSSLLGAVFTICLLVSSAPAMQDMEAGHEGHQAAAESTMDANAMDHENMDTDHGAMDHGDMDHDNMDMADQEHDHEGMMEKAGKEVGIEEKLGSIVADVSFVDAEGNRVNLRDLTRDVPTILVPIYFRCPDVCNLLQGSLAAILSDVALEPGKEYKLLSISFDPREDRKDAARAKRTYLAAAQGAIPPEDWNFLVAEGDTKAVDAWLDSIGYTVKREGGLYAHPVAVLAIAPGGKVVRYLYGSTFLPFDITMAATEAATGKTGLSIKRMLSFCYNYDPQGRRYVFSILRVSGFAIVGFVGAFVLYLVLSGRKDKKKRA